MQLKIIKVNDMVKMRSLKCLDWNASIRYPCFPGDGSWHYTFL